MQTKNNVLNVAMTLMIGGSLLASCGPTKSPNTSAPTGTTASSTPTGTTASSTPTQSGSTSTPNSASNSNAALVAAEMQAVTADDATMSDSQKADSGFTTAALNIPVRGEVSALGDVRVGTALRTRVAVQTATRTRLAAARKTAATMAMQKKAALLKAGVTVNANGSITIDPAALKSFVKANVETRRAKLQTIKAQFSAKLKNLKAAAAAQVQTMRRKNNVTRTSDVVETTNADGSVTKTLTVDFKNDKTGVMRTVTTSRTTLNSKLVSSDYELSVTGPNGYTRNVNRSVTVNADGSRSASTTATTTWPNGAKSERSETREISADGSATGSGSLTITRADGSVKTYNYTVGVTASAQAGSGDETVECTSGNESPAADASASADVEVTVEDTAASATDTVVVTEGGSATEESVDETADADVVVEASAEADASAS